MEAEDFLHERLSASGLHAREIREFAYLKHKTGASEAQIRTALARVGPNRGKVERELTRRWMIDRF